MSVEIVGVLDRSSMAILGKRIGINMFNESQTHV
jgi:hypothetical protein